MALLVPVFHLAMLAVDAFIETACVAVLVAKFGDDEACIRLATRPIGLVDDTSLLVQAGRIDDMAYYLGGIIGELAAASAAIVAIAAITPHICLAKLKRGISVLIIDITAQHLRERNFKRVALFGTNFTIYGRMFGAFDYFAVVRPHDAEVDEI